MLDIKKVRQNPEIVVEALKKRGANLSLDEFLRLDEKRRKLLVDVEQKKFKRNTVSEEIGRLKKEGKSAEKWQA